MNIKDDINPEPIAETVTLYGGEWTDGIWEFGNNTKKQTHCLSFEVIDGDPCNVKIERIDETE